MYKIYINFCMNIYTLNTTVWWRVYIDLDREIISLLLTQMKINFFFFTQNM